MGPTRRLYSCGDCEETWDAICDAGVPSVCRFVGAGYPFSAEAGASIELLCNTFGNACDDSTGDEVCEGQCVWDGDDNDDDDDDDDDNVQGGGIVVCTDFPENSCVYPITSSANSMLVLIVVLKMDVTCGHRPRDRKKCSNIIIKTNTDIALAKPDISTTPRVSWNT